MRPARCANLAAVDNDLLPVIALRVMNGRVGSTLVMQLLATDDDIVFDRTHPFGEYRALSYCIRVGSVIGSPHDPDHHRVTPFFFEGDGAGPIPWEPTAFDRGRLGPPASRALWATFSAAMRARRPTAAWYAEKLACEVDDLAAAAIPHRVVDLVRDPRDTLASIRAFTATGIDGLDGAATADPTEYLDRFVARTRTVITRMLAPGPAERLLLRYEDVATDLPAAARTLGDWLGRRLDGAAVAADRARYVEHTTTESVAASIGRWRTDLAPDEAERIWAGTGDLLTALGYDRDGPRPFAPARVP
jgi:hypothetical protein